MNSVFVVNASASDYDYSWDDVLKVFKNEETANKFLEDLEKDLQWAIKNRVKYANQYHKISDAYDAYRNANDRKAIMDAMYKEQDEFPAKFCEGHIIAYPTDKLRQLMSDCTLIGFYVYEVPFVEE